MKTTKQKVSLLAFYRGQSAFADRVICGFTRSEFSHVEFLPCGAGPGASSISSSGRDGGVRWKQIDFNSDRWDLIEVPWAPVDALQRIKQHLGASYDYPGLIGSQLFNLRRQSQSRWFCSEICGHALGFSLPHELSPGGLRRRVMEANAIYDLGRSRSGEPPEE